MKQLDLHDIEKLEKIMSLKPHTIVEFDDSDYTNVSVTRIDTQCVYFTFGESKRETWINSEMIKKVISENETINFKISEETQDNLFARESSIDHWL